MTSSSMAPNTPKLHFHLQKVGPWTRWVTGGWGDKEVKSPLATYETEENHPKVSTHRTRSGVKFPQSNLYMLCNHFLENIYNNLAPFLLCCT